MLGEDLIQDRAYKITPFKNSWDKHLWQLPKPGEHILTKITPVTGTFKVDGFDKDYRIQSHTFQLLKEKSVMLRYALILMISACVGISLFLLLVCNA